MVFDSRFNYSPISPPEEYQKGFTTFCGAKIDLSHPVLIPRPETELMTRLAIRDLILANLVPVHILDIFSGSGCIGTAIAKNIPYALVDFSDIDSQAIQQIKINISLNNINLSQIQVFCSDIFSAIPLINKYDAILANPPYIDPARINEVQDSVLKYEPGRALFGGRGGLEIIRSFLSQAQFYLNDNSFIYLEFDPQQINAVKNILDKYQYTHYFFLKDQFGLNRFVKIIYEKNHSRRK